MGDLDIRDLMLEATATVQEVMREIGEELTLPLMKKQIKQSWISAPDEMKERFKQERPNEYTELMDTLK